MIRSESGKLAGSLELILVSGEVNDDYDEPERTVEIVDCFAFELRDLDELAACERCGLSAILPTIGEDCGTLGSEGSAPAVAYCVQEKLESGEPFHVVTELQGIDSVVLYVFVLDESGTLRRYLYDSDICGGSGCNQPGCGPRISVVVCEEPKFTIVADGGSRFEVGNELISCGSLRDEPPICAPN